jgi:hypothetical protein
MKHSSLDELQRVAAIHKDRPAETPMSRSDRLARWGELLDKQPHRILSTFPGTEYQTVEARDVMRDDNSPIAVAFADPVLRADGMRDDSYGEAKRFFEISDWQLHDILCYCHHGSTMKAETAARRVRAAAATRPPGGVLSRMRQALVG